MEQFILFVPVKQFVSVEHFFIPMVRLDPVEQILIFVSMEQFIPMKQFVPMLRLNLIEQILIFVPMVQLDATNFK